MKLKSLWMVLLTLGMVLVTGCAVWADSLWGDQSSSLYGTKPHDFKVGDLLTIVIVEQAEASQTAKSANDEKGNVSAGPGSGALKKILPQVGGSWDSKYAGDGSTARVGTLKAKLSVQVKSIQPNGVLTVEGRQVIKINNEDQVLTITGMVRPEDVSTDNVIYSTNIANAVIEYQGKGTVSETQQPGVLSGFFHWLF